MNYLSPAGLTTPAALTDNPVTVLDCTGSNVGSFPVLPGQLLAGYVTGSGDVPWTAAQFSRYPDAVRIDQSPVNTPADMTADVYDLEANAGTIAGLPEWVHGAWASYSSGQRPGQRAPAVYASLSNVTAVVNALLAAGITHGVNLWVAGTMDAVRAEHLIASANGPFPIIGVQYEFHGLFDVSLFSGKWLGTRSGNPAAPHPQPGTQTGWAFCGKCQGLFYGPGVVDSHCPAGGPHDGTHSHSYTLGFDW